MELEDTSLYGTYIIPELGVSLRRCYWSEYAYYHIIHAEVLYIHPDSNALLSNCKIAMELEAIS